MDASDGAFVFADDGVHFFPTVAEAAGYLEAIDVENGEYEAFFTPLGERLLPRILDDRSVALPYSGVTDVETLLHLLRRERDERGSFTSDHRDFVAVANELLAAEWSARWPKWPRWLDRRIHGSGPPQV